MRMVLEALGSHPNIVSLDVGDCLLGDKVLYLVSKLLPSKGAKRGWFGYYCSQNVFL